MDSLIVRFLAAFGLALASCGQERYPVSPTAPDWLEGAVLEQGKTYAPGAHQQGEMFKGIAYEEDAHTDWQIPMEFGKCYWFSAVGDQTVGGLSLYLWHPNGRRLETIRRKGSRAIMHHCIKGANGLYKVQVKVSEGYGHYQMAVFSKDSGSSSSPVQEKAPQPKELSAEVEDLAKNAAPGAKRVGELFEGKASQTDWYVQLDANTCYWFVGAGDSGVEELHLYLWDPKDRRITQNKSESNRVTVGHCPEIAGMYHFQAKVDEGAGQYKVGVYGKAK